MTKEYLVTGTYMDKETGKMMSSIAPISGGISKSGHPYEIADTSSREKVEGEYRVGTRLTGSMTLTVAANADNTTAPRPMKLGKD